jgi:hypothetical protein
MATGDPDDDTALVASPFTKFIIEILFVGYVTQSVGPGAAQGVSPGITVVPIDGICDERNSAY